MDQVPMSDIRPLEGKKVTVAYELRKGRIKRESGTLNIMSDNLRLKVVKPGHDDDRIISLQQVRSVDLAG